jgi:succinate dehydrogenase/fumarate reductase flavoprotein subunit
VTDELIADVVVVGLGVAGLGGALAASELGASVVALEQQPSDRHTPSFRMSGGIIMGATDVAQAAAYLDRCAGGLTPKAVSAAWAASAADVVDWLNDICPPLNLVPMGGAEHPDVEGSGAIVAYRQGAYRDGTTFAAAASPADGLGRLEDQEGRRQTARAAMGLEGAYAGQMRTGFEFYGELRKLAEQRDNIEILWETPVDRLERPNGGAVTAVLARAGDGEIRIRARKGVLLATGGYENDEELKRQYLGPYPTYFYGNPGNAGAGVRLAQAVGADLWHMSLMIGRGVCHFDREDGSSLDISMQLDGGGYVITDRQGERFFNEYRQATADHDVYYDMISFDTTVRGYPRVPSFYFFVERRRMFGPMVPPGVGPSLVGICDWSSDNQREIDRGWLKRGASISEVAAAVGVENPDAAARSVARYNEACSEGSDPLGRPPSSLVPLDQPPFYAVAMYPGGSNTCGGPRRDEYGRVLDPFGDPIAGLYCAGSLGSAIGLLYPAWGCNLSDGICFGRIAAAHALGRLDD